MRQLIIFAVLLSSLISCNGEIERKIIYVKEPEQIEIRHLAADYVTKKDVESQKITAVPIGELAKNGFKETGIYNEDRECPGKIYRKEFIESFHYIFTDCKNNQVYQIIRK